MRETVGATDWNERGIDTTVGETVGGREGFLVGERVAGYEGRIEYVGALDIVGMIVGTFATRYTYRELDVDITDAQNMPVGSVATPTIGDPVVGTAREYVHVLPLSLERYTAALDDAMAYCPEYEDATVYQRDTP